VAPSAANGAGSGVKSRGNPWVILIVVSLGFFMTLLDLTIVNIAIPNMISKLHASLDDILWVINAYALVLAVLLITAGRLGDLLGQRRVFIAGIAVFTLSSAACGLAPSPGWLIAFRGVQGLGAALLMPQTLAILTMVFPPERRGAAFGVWGAVAGVATIAGPTLGGLLTTAFDWRYIFFINLPVGVLVLVLAPLLIPDLRTGRKHSFDVGGVVLATLALLAICYALVEGQKYNWGTIAGFISIPLLAAVGLVIMAVFVWLQARRQNGEPLVPFALFKDRNYALMNMVVGLLGLGMLGIFLPFSIYLQSVLGFSALKAGLTMAPGSVVSMFVAPVAGRLTDRIGGKYILMTGLTLFGGGMGVLALIAQPTSAWYDFILPQVIAGVGIGCIFPPMTTVAMRNVNPAMAGAASGVFNTTRQLGTVIGTAGVGALLQNRLVAGLTSQARLRTAGLPPQAREKLIAGFQSAAKGGLQVGSGHRTTGLAGEIFTHGFVSAMRPTMLVPILFIAAGALSCALIKRQPRTSGADAAAELGEAAATAAG
jgi:EmrB/QacA subfamily drug resistance transporter